MIVVTQQVEAGWKHFQARFAEWLNAAILFAWGCYILLHPGMMTNPSVAGLWRGMLAVAAEQTWGLVAVIVGLSRLGALYINGAHRRTPAIRLAAAFASAFVFTQIVTGMVNANAPNTGIIVYSALIFADAYSAFRASSDATVVAKTLEGQAEMGSGSVTQLRKSA